MGQELLELALIQKDIKLLQKEIILTLKEKEQKLILLLNIHKEDIIL